MLVFIDLYQNKRAQIILTTKKERAQIIVTIKKKKNTNHTKL